MQQSLVLKLGGSVIFKKCRQDGGGFRAELTAVEK